MDEIEKFLRRMENMTTPAVLHNVTYNDTYNDPYDSPRIIPLAIPMVIFSVVCVLGVLGNGVVIWVTGFRMKKTVSTVWYLNLAVADFLATAALLMQITYYALDKHWPFGWFMCKMLVLLFHMNMYASIFTLAVISVDRCVGVVWPLWARCSGYRTVRKASWVSLGVWVLALAPSIPAFISRDTLTYSDDKVRCYNSYTFTTTGVITNVVVGFVVPLSVIVSCYSVIIYQIRNNRPLAGQSGRSFKVIAAVIAAFFLCWLPLHIIQLIHVCVEEGLIDPSDTLRIVLGFVYPITRALALLNSCMNPLLYVFSQGFKDVFRYRSIIKVLEKAFAEEPPQTSNTPTDPAVTSPETEEPPQTSNTPTDPDVTSPETEEPPQTSNTPTDPDVTSPETEEPPQTSNTPTDPDVTSPETEEPPQTSNTPTDPDVTSPETEEPPQTSKTHTDPDVTSPEIALSETEGGTVPPGTQNLSGETLLSETLV